MGIVLPIVVTVLLIVSATVDAVRYGDWDLLLTTPIMAGTLVGPFVIYYFVCRSTEFSLLIGVALVAVAIFALVALKINLDGGSSTAALSILWIPFIGYPLVCVAGFLDYMGSPPPGWGYRPTRPRRPRRWSASVRGNSLEITRRRNNAE